MVILGTTIESKEKSLWNDLLTVCTDSRFKMVYRFAERNEIIILNLRILPVDNNICSYGVLIIYYICSSYVLPVINQRHVSTLNIKKDKVIYGE